MRVLLSTIGSRGDVQPLVALAWQLRAIGQQVHLCVPPDFQDWIAGLGMPVTPVGPQVRGYASRPLDRGRDLMEETVADQFAAITVAAQGCHMIVAATALQFAARSVAERLGIPYAFAAYAPTVLPTPHHAPPPLPPLPGETPTTDNRELWARGAARFNDLFLAPVNANRASIALPPIDDVRSHMFGDRPWLAADPTLAPWPDPADPSVIQTGAWILPDARPLSHGVEAFLEAGEPPVFFGFGSTRAPQDLSDVMIRAARALGRRTIVSRGWADLALTDDQPDCLTVGEVNVQALFTRVAAVVHHGGAGTTTIAALAGTPQVVIPQVYDQHYFAQRIEHLGIGTAHASGAPTADSLTAALARSLQPEVSVRARTVAPAVRRDGAATAAAMIVGQDR